MACASASELNRRVAIGLATASLLPEPQNLRTSMHPFEYLLRLGSNDLPFSGSGEPTKHSFSRMILLRAEAESSACFRPHAETKPCAQLDATYIHPGNSTEIEDHHAPSSAV